MSKTVLLLFALVTVGAGMQIRIPSEDGEKDFVFNFSWNIFPNSQTTPSVPPAAPACLYGINTVSCLCGTVFCTAGQSCDVATNTCSYSPACPAGVPSPTSCLCGTTYCQTGQSCDPATSTCSYNNPQYPTCPDQTGTAANPMECTCGSVTPVICSAPIQRCMQDATGLGMCLP